MTRATLPGRSRRQRGGIALALVIVLSTLAIMLGALAIRGSVVDLRVAGTQRFAKTGFYCAEAGLSAARAYFGANRALWSTMFAGGAVAGYPFTGDLDGDGVADFQVTLRDNVDEFPPQANNANVDNDLTAVMVSRCISPTMATRELREIVTGPPRGTDYRHQAGSGSAHTGNKN